MWICSKLGFFSLVRTDPAGRWQVRARVEQDLTTLLAAAGLKAEILSPPDSDYTCLVEVDLAALNMILTTLAGSLDYANFKECLAALPEQRDRLIAYDDFWHTMRKILDQNAGAKSTGGAHRPIEIARRQGGHLARVLENINGFKDKYGHWPTRLRLSRTAYVALQEKHLTASGFTALAARLELKLGDKDELIAEDTAGLAFDYTKEGWANRRPPQEADDWLWQVKL